MKTLIKEVITLVFARGAIRLAQVVSFFLLAKFLSPAGFGIYGVVTSAVMMAGILGSLGLRQSGAYMIGQKKLTEGQVLTTVWLVCPALALASTAILFSLDSGLYGSLGPLFPVVMFFAVFGTIFLTVTQGVFLGRGEVAAFGTSEVGPRLFLTIATVVIAFGYVLDLGNALWVYATSFLVMIPWLVWKSTKGGHLAAPRLDVMPGMLRYGIIFAVTLFLSNFNARIAMFVLEAQGQAAESGQYFAAYRLNELFLELVSAVGMVLFSHSVRRADSAKLLGEVARISSWMFWLFIPTAGVIAIVAPVLVGLALGPEYAPAGHCMQIIALGLAPAAASRMIYSAVAGQGRPYFGTVALVGGTTVNAIMLYLLTPTMGAVGGAIALVTSQYLIYAAYVVLVSTFFSVPLKQLLVPSRSDAMKIANVMWTKSRTILRR